MPLERTLQVTYAGITLGGSSGRHIDGYTIDETQPERGVFECDFVTLACTTGATFSAECLALEIALSTPRGALVVTDNSNSLISWSHSSNTGFDGVATIRKIGGPGDSGLSRRYHFRFECGLPADATRYNTSGRRSGTVDVKYDSANRRHVTIAGVYTALSASSARTQWASAIDAYCASVLSDIGITSYQEVENPVTRANDTNKTIDFSRVYDELFFTTGIFADTSVKKAEMKISREKVGPGDSMSTDRLATVNATFDCWIDGEVTKDLKSKYPTIRSTIVTQIRSVLELGQICLVSDKPDFDYVNNKISASLVLYGTTGGNVLEYRYTTHMKKTPGTVLLPAWTGDPLSYFVTPGPARYIRTTTITKRVLAGTGGGEGSGTMLANVAFAGGSEGSGLPAAPAEVPAGGDGSAGSASGGGAGAANQSVAAQGANADVGTETLVLIDWDKTTTPLKMGTRDESQIDVEDITEVSVAQIVKAIRGGSAAPAGGTVETVDPHPELNRR